MYIIRNYTLKLTGYQTNLPVPLGSILAPTRIILVKSIDSCSCCAYTENIDD